MSPHRRAARTVRTAMGETKARLRTAQSRSADLVAQADRSDSLPPGPESGQGPDALQELAELGALTRTLSLTDPERRLSELLTGLRQATRAEIAEIFLMEPLSGDLLLAMFQGPFRSKFVHIERFPARKGFPGIVAESRQPIVTRGLAQDARYLRSRVKETGFQSYVCVPIPGSEGIIGTLHVASRDSGLDLERGERLLRWASVPLGTLMEATFFKARLATVSGGAWAPPAAGGAGPMAPLREVLRTMMAVGGATAGTFALIGTGPRRPAHLIVEGRTRHSACIERCGELPPDCPALGLARGIIVSESRRQQLASCRQAATGDSTLQCIPLLANGERLGLVQLWHPDPQPPLPGRHLPILLHMASQAAQLINVAGTDLGVHPDNRISHPLPEAPTAAMTNESADGGPFLSSPRRNGSPLEVRCLGTFEVHREGRLITPDMVQRRGALTLLKLLLRRPGHPISRDALVESLWEDADLQAGANRLYILVHALRQTIEPPRQGRDWLYIRNEGDCYYFDASAPYWLDTEVFQRLVQQGEAAEAAQKTAEAIEAYEAAVALYRGDYLEDDSHAEWAWEERDHLRETYLSVLERLAARHTEMGAKERSIEFYQRALRLDPLRERPCRDLMTVLWQAGRRVDALREYERFRRVLQRELGIEPMPETQALYARIRLESSACSP
jgi:DNA-binding SARP family transcriptional activator